MLRSLWYTTPYDNGSPTKPLPQPLPLSHHHHQRLLNIFNTLWLNEIPKHRHTHIVIIMIILYIFDTLNGESLTRSSFAVCIVAGDCNSLSHSVHSLCSQHASYHQSLIIPSFFVYCAVYASQPSRPPIHRSPIASLPSSLVQRFQYTSLAVVPIALALWKVITMFVM